MKKRTILGALLLLLLPIFMMIGSANGQTFRSGDVTTIGANETVSSSLFASGRTVDIAGTVDGDVICGGVNVLVSGTVRGDVICGGQNVTVSGEVEGDVRLAGQSVTIGGQIGGSASVAASVFSLESRAQVSRDLSVASGDISLQGEVGRDAALAGASAVLGNQIGRNVNASVENLRLSSQADIGGGLYYTSSRDAEVAEGAQVAGETRRTQPAQTKRSFESPFKASASFALYVIASLLILSLALVLLFPRLIHTVTNQAVAQPLKVLLVGFVASLAVPVLVVVLMITVLGIPLALLVLGVWLLVLFLAGPVFSYYVGRLLLSGHRTALLVMALGAFVVLLLLFVPVIGFLVWLAAMWMGAGMILLEAMKLTPRPHYEIEPVTSSK